MTRGVRLYLVGSFVLVSLAGCGRGLFQSAEREPWRAEAEVACLKSGAVKETPELVRIDPISGPGACGAQFPLKVAALGEGSPSFGFADELRPPGNIGNQPRWPVRPAPAAAPSQTYSDQALRQPSYGAPSNGPISLTAPGVAQQDDEIDLPAEGAPQSRDPRGGSYMAAPSYPPRDRYPSSPNYSSAPYSQAPAAAPPPRLGPVLGDPVNTVGPVAIKPTATLACPIVSVLDRWLADSVQPAAQRWFGVRVVEIKQISAYSCRGMNGNPNSHISEHAFGNALDISAFVLADGRRVTVRGGWRGMPEEQGFLRDVQASACQQFNTVLAPGSNRHHEDHLHVDLMRRSSGRVICQPAAVSGDQVAGRAGGRSPYASSREPWTTGSLGGRKAHRHSSKVNEEDEFDGH
ncbi:extensin family protein [Bradyrhizobium sp. AUGA SZCCT0240]|uniref:extensin-like domain-containing protein n=1 Tax=unclassified Bradyrhizobium TaxID=2631580 RepID=UPI001BA515DD|nr:MULTISPECIES: extensin family protein [unclassified Bradyrhizobium]MBR1198566.1 extensin family protein [Bradyrhizobium sp. AUGA SZCCT0158]MBR1243981.1 extensin family protein [Bradyrhizobium sp. AUGA SZCCT0274]MBR1255584.1 extensin family protein [Bradyrhizobium sp. AUGA SZCCT0240]